MDQNSNYPKDDKSLVKQEIDNFFRSVQVKLEVEVKNEMVIEVPGSTTGTVNSRKRKKRAQRNRSKKKRVKKNSTNNFVEPKPDTSVSTSKGKGRKKSIHRKPNGNTSKNNNSSSTKLEFPCTNEHGSKYEVQTSCEVPEKLENTPTEENKSLLKQHLEKYNYLQNNVPNIVGDCSLQNNENIPNHFINAVQNVNPYNAKQDPSVNKVNDNIIIIIDSDEDESYLKQSLKVEK